MQRKWVKHEAPIDRSLLSHSIDESLLHECRVLVESSSSEKMTETATKTDSVNAFPLQHKCGTEDLTF